jgi:integrase
LRSLSDRRRGERTFADYGSDWLAAQELKVSTGQLKRSTLDGYGLIPRAYALPKPGHLPIASISAADVERACAKLVGQPTRQGGGTLSPRSVRQVWNTMRRVFLYAMQHNAIVSNPLDRVDFSANRSTGDRERFTPHPLTASQVAEISAALAGQRVDADGSPLPAHPVYALMVEFAAYSGLRKGELAGLEIRDLSFVPVAAGSPAKAPKLDCTTGQFRPYLATTFSMSS